MAVRVGGAAEVAGVAGSRSVDLMKLAFESPVVVVAVVVAAAAAAEDNHSECPGDLAAVAVVEAAAAGTRSADLTG